MLKLENWKAFCVFLAVAGSGAVLLHGCDSDGSAGVGTQDVAADAAVVPEAIEEGCEHAAGGPFTPSVATADATGAPSITEPHTAHVVTLVDMAGGKGGSVTYASSEAADYVVMLSADVPLSVTAPDGATVEIEATTPVDACDELAVAHTIEMGVGTYTLVFGPTDEATVTLVVEESAHVGEHE